MAYQYPLADEFESYLKKKEYGLKEGNINNIMSRINTLLNKGYTSRIDKKHFDIIDKQLRGCLGELPQIISSSKKNHNLALQLLAAVFASLDIVIQNNPEHIRTLRDIRSAFMHYYLFIEEQLIQSKRAKKNIQVNFQKIQQALNTFYGNTSRILCFTQREVRDIFIQRLHSQDRLYNHNLLFPISLIVKLYGRTDIAKGWTNGAIDDIEILINANKKKTICFKDVSFFLFKGSNVYVFDRKRGDEHKVFTRQYRIIEENKAVDMEVHDFGQPLQSFAIDHKTPMAELINIHSGRQDVQHLQALSDDFCTDITNFGRQHLANKDNKWLTTHNYAQGLDILNSKTINDLSTGYKDNPTRKVIKLQDIIDDIKLLHISGQPNKDGLELMDAIQNGIKRDF